MREVTDDRDAQPFPPRNTDVHQSLAEGTESGHATVARNAFYLMLGQVMTTALVILFSSALGRMLGASDFGLYFLIVSFSSFAYVLV
jgi:hypothetical protein